MIRFTCVKDYGSYRTSLNQEVDDNVTTAHPSQHGQFPGKSTVRCIETRKENGKKSFLELEVQYLYIFFQAFWQAIVNHL
jgi:hypothetical protein